jgi:S1-C subfamily serine protease
MAIRYLSLAADAGENFIYKSEAQRKLAEAYKYGYGVSKDTQRAFEYFNKSAFLGDSTSQLSLVYAFEAGEGVVQNSSAALVWLYVNRASGGAASQKTVNMFEQSFDHNSLVEIRKQAREILQRIKANVARGSAQKHAPASPSGLKTTGTGVIISSAGLIITAAHVVDDSSKIEVILAEGPREASIVQIDSKNDLAILRVQGSAYPAAPLAASKDVKLGQPVFTIGFPNTDIQGASPKFTKGEISSLNGMRDEPTQWQISVPVQSGNSGSPLFDEAGNVVGIVVSKLNAIETAKTTGDLIQNVNYAVKNAYLFPMLEKFPDKLEGSKKRGIFKKFESVVEDSKKSVVLILAY